ncbi:autotransporter outer membrane beta-barrel domain-containing protein [Achromobacter deleyi]|nr:autotransporter outer membrane beta-barrel domain-containing protein [Achromobacter deleyi]
MKSYQPLAKNLKPRVVWLGVSASIVSTLDPTGVSVAWAACGANGPGAIAGPVLCQPATGDANLSTQPGTTITVGGEPNVYGILVSPGAAGGNATVDIQGTTIQVGPAPGIGLYVDYGGTGASNLAVNLSGTNTISLNSTAGSPSTNPVGVLVRNTGTGSSNITVNGQLTLTNLATATNAVFDGGLMIRASNNATSASIVHQGSGRIETHGGPAIGISALGTSTTASVVLGQNVSLYVDNTVPGASVNQNSGIATSTVNGLNHVVSAASIETLGYTARGIKADSTGTGSVIVEHTGSILTHGDESRGINALSTSGDVQVFQRGTIVTEGRTASGVDATSTAGNVTVQNSASITTSGDNTIGVLAWTRTLGSTKTIQIENNGSVTIKGAADQRGLSAEGTAGLSRITGSGDITLTNAGTLATSAGMLARTETGLAQIDYSGSVTTARSIGLFSVANAGGDIDINYSGRIQTSGDSAHGIRAIARTNAPGSGAGRAPKTGGIVIRNLGPILTQGNGAKGIYAENFGSGVISIDNRGAITTQGLNADGIYANSSLIGNPVAFSPPGPLTITSSGKVTATGNGIYAINGTKGTDLSVTATADITGGSNGIYARNDGTGATRIAVGSGSVVQGGTAAIVAGSAGQAFSISNAGAIQNLSNQSNALAIQTEKVGIGGAASAAVTISNDALITGTLDLGGPGNRLMNNAQGIWNTAGGTNEFGAASAGNSVANAGTVIAANGTAADPAQVTTFNNLDAFSNAGTLTMANGRAGDTTVISGTYISAGGQLLLDTVLGDDASATDKLVAGGVALGGGATAIHVNNTGGLGALTTGNGIELVHVNGGAAASAPGAFVLSNRVAASAYEYTLHQNGIAGEDGNWYLRSTLPETPPEVPPKPEVPNYRREVPVDMVAPALASRLGLAMLGTCDDRVAASFVGSKTAACGDVVPGKAVWGRLFGETGDVGFSGRGTTGRVSSFESHGPSYDFNLGGFQTGVDLWSKATDGGSRNIAGLYFGAGSIDATVDLAQGGGTAGKTSMNGYSLGGYWTHKNADGWYLDSVLQGTRYDNVRASSRSPEGQTLKTNGWGWAASIEAGHSLLLSDDG